MFRFGPDWVTLDCNFRLQYTSLYISEFDRCRLGCSFTLRLRRSYVLRCRFKCMHDAWGKGTTALAFIRQIKINSFLINITPCLMTYVINKNRNSGKPCTKEATFSFCTWHCMHIKGFCTYLFWHLRMGSQMAVGCNIHWLFIAHSQWWINSLLSWFVSKLNL